MKYAVVTGATHGIGKAIAEKLLSEGMSVAICARNNDELDALKKTWAEQYPSQQILVVKTDVAQKDEVKAFAKIVLAAFPTIDILVNNAGTYYPGKLMEEPEDQLELLMQVNTYSAYHITRAFFPSLQKQGCGHIFNICSVASLKAYENGGAYSISKYALLGFSENLREEMKPHNIRVTAICPGATDSRSWEGASLPAGRIMEATDVANMLWASYILSAQANVDTIVLRPQKGDI